MIHLRNLIGNCENPIAAGHTSKLAMDNLHASPTSKFDFIYTAQVVFSVISTSRLGKNKLVWILELHRTQ